MKIAKVALLPLLFFVLGGARPPDEVLTPHLPDGEAGFRPEVQVYYSAGRTRGILSLHRPDGSRYTSLPLPIHAAHAADLNGDGFDELILGVWSRVRRFQSEPSPHRAIWVMGWDGDSIVPLWQGSAMARPLLDFSLATPSDGPASLFALERWEDRCYWTVYQWNGFGFFSDEHRVVRCDASLGPDPQCLTLVDDVLCASDQRDSWRLP